MCSELVSELETCEDSIMCPLSPSTVLTTTIIPSRSPAPNVVIICWGAGHCTVCTVCTVYSGQQPVQCRVTLDSCGADVRLFSHNTQCSPAAPRWHRVQCLHPGLIQFIIQSCLLTSIYRVTPDSDHIDTGWHQLVTIYIHTEQSNSNNIDHGFAKFVMVVDI